MHANPLTLNYAIVIATRNRLHALSLSIPRMLNQSHPPAELIIADSSDDHESVAKLVTETVGSHPVRLVILKTERGAAVQRNIGLEHVTYPVVFFPDDDSIFFPKAAESICAVYANDNESKIAAVCAAESVAPPEDFAIKQASYKMSALDRLKKRVHNFRSRLENRFIPDPVRALGRKHVETTRLPKWALDTEVVPVETMTGFRMTFRTEVIRQIKFDESLKRYSLMEDRDASLSAWRHGAVVGARRAKIFHFRSPEVRDGGRRLGVQHLLNPTYVVVKHTQKSDYCRKLVRRFCYYKAFLYLVSVRSKFERDRFLGAFNALQRVPQLSEVESDQATHNYRIAMKECLGIDG